jgi:hypothetical protein
MLPVPILMFVVILSLITCPLSAQTYARFLDDAPGSATSFRAEGEAAALANGDILVFDEWTAMRVTPEGAIVWARNYEFDGDPVNLTDVHELPDGDLVSAIMVGELQGPIMGWLRMDAQGMPQESKIWSDAPGTYTDAGLDVHPNGAWSMYSYSFGGPTNPMATALFRFSANGELQLAQQRTNAVSTVGPLNVHAWYEDLYIMDFRRIRRFDTYVTEVSFPTYANMTMVRIRPHAHGVYFTGHSNAKPCFGLIDHDGALQWIKAIECADPVFLDGPVFSAIDIIHGPQGDLIYVDVNSEDEIHLFLFNNDHEPVSGRRMFIEHEPERLARTTQGGAALVYSIRNNALGTILHTIGPSLEPIGCGDDVEFTTSEVALEAANSTIVPFVAFAPQWMPLTVEQEVVNATSVLYCAEVGIPETRTEHIFLSPQPAMDHVQVSGLPPGTLQFAVYDATGRLMSTGKGEGPTHRIPTSGATTGVHYLQVFNDEHSWKLPFVQL